ETEQRSLETIIGTKEKYRRNNERRYNSIRNEKGLTKKQQELEDLRAKVLALKEKGLNNTQISKELNIDRAKTRRLLK
ncbi:MAG: hypothetical protein ACRCXT_23500, partial [Paraclostridium sp.]